MVLKLRDRIAASPAGSERALTRDEMVELASAVDLHSLDLGDHSGFKKECYARNTVLLNDHVELVVICWLPGQASAVHDHGQSNCLYLIVDGQMQEELFDLGGNGRPESKSNRSFGRGEITVAGSDDIHRITNVADEKLVTIHIYSPPLDEKMTMYTPIPRTETAH